jgi:hypothetical protein
VKEIKLTISDKVFRKLKNEISTKKICMGMAYTSDYFILELISKLDKGESEWDVQLKSEKK